MYILGIFYKIIYIYIIQGFMYKFGLGVPFDHSKTVELYE